jgi:hypothetical protein
VARPDFLGDRPIKAKVVIVRHPAVLRAAADQLPRIEAELVVLVGSPSRHWSENLTAGVPNARASPMRMRRPSRPCR